MKKNNIIFILALFFILFNSSISYAKEDKSILILIDELDFQLIEEVFNKAYGAGLINIKTRKPYGNESLYFSIATGRKVGVKSDFYKGLYKNQDGSIDILGFDELYRNLIKQNNKIKLNLLGEKLEEQGLSYIGDNSSAIVAANKDGKIKSGEVAINYDNEWLKDRTNYHLSNSNILVLSYEIGETKDRVRILKNYIQDYINYNIIIIPKSVSPNMKYILNESLVPIVYINGETNGLLTSLSTKRNGFITFGDIYTELISTQGMTTSISIGNNIEVLQNENNFRELKVLFKKTINLIWVTSLFHGMVYFLQAYNAYYIYKNRKDKLSQINLYNNFIIINIFISLLIGASSLHINIFLYLFMNLLVTYIITVFISDKDTNVIGLFATLTYALILLGILFYPELIYNSYIGFNNLFYGARYYGFNNGIMGVLLVTSIISYFFIKDIINNPIIINLLCILYFLANMIVLSANYGANTGGFITSAILFLIMVYNNLLGKDYSSRNMSILILIALSIFAINMYFDYHSSEKSHAINFLMRIRTFGFNEFLDMFKLKAKELVKWTILPPFSLVIISQVFSLKKLKYILLNFKNEYYIILFVAIIGFVINDTGMITFIYMIHYLISLMIYDILKSPSID